MTLRSGMNSAARNIIVKLDTIAVPQDYDPLNDTNPYMNPLMLAYFYKRLLTERKQAAQELQELRSHIATPAHVGDEGDRATATMERDLAHAQIQKLLGRQEVISVHLIEMDQNGTHSNYGYCEDTGDEIGIERLYKMPYARFTVEVQQRFEREDKQRNARGCRMDEVAKTAPYKPTGRYFG